MHIGRDERNQIFASCTNREWTGASWILLVTVTKRERDLLIPVFRQWIGYSDERVASDKDQIWSRWDIWDCKLCCNVTKQIPKLQYKPIRTSDGLHTSRINSQRFPQLDTHSISDEFHVNQRGRWAINLLSHDVFGFLNLALLTCMMNRQRRFLTFPIFIERKLNLI